MQHYEREMKCVAIIPAAGSGTRFGGVVPKQYLELGGKPIIVHVLNRFASAPRIDGIVVAAGSDQFDRLRELLARERIAATVVEGGATRQQSVLAGLKEAIGAGAGVVAVHDSVRPLFSQKLLDETLDAAIDAGGAVPALPVSDTIHRGAGDLIRETLDRSTLYAAQTPQCFRAPLLLECLERAERESLSGTDEGAMVARYGHAVRLVPGEVHNIKITTPDDLFLAERLLKEQK